MRHANGSGTARGESADALLLRLQETLALEYLSDLKSARADRAQLLAAITEIGDADYGARQWQETARYLCGDDAAAPGDDAAAWRDYLLDALAAHAE